MSVKALTHWIIYKGYRVRFTRRTPQEVEGILFTPEGETPFVYHRQTHQITLPTTTVNINEHGWELDREI